MISLDEALDKAISCLEGEQEEYHHQDNKEAISLLKRLHSDG